MYNHLWLKEIPSTGLLSGTLLSRDPLFQILTTWLEFDFVSVLLDMFLCVYQGDKPLDTLRKWLKTYGRELDQETRQNCFETEKFLKRALTGEGEELFSNLGEFELLCLEFHSFMCHMYSGMEL